MMLGRCFIHFRFLRGGTPCVPCLQKLYSTNEASQPSSSTSKAAEVLSNKYGRHDVFMGEKMMELIKKVQRHENDYSSEEVQIAKLTVQLRNLRALARKNDKSKKHVRTRILHAFEERWQLLNELRRFRYEAYHKVLKELNTQHILEPELWVNQTQLAEDVEDMRIRAFAEKLKQEAEEAKIRNEFETLKEQIKQELLEKEKE